jgi:hypothetical protein
LPAQQREKRGKKKQCESASCVIKAAKIIQCASPGEPKVPRQTAQAGEKHTRRGRYRKSVERRREEKNHEQTERNSRGTGKNKETLEFYGVEGDVVCWRLESAKEKYWLRRKYEKL